MKTAFDIAEELAEEGQRLRDLARAYLMVAATLRGLRDDDPPAPTCAVCGEPILNDRGICPVHG